MKYQRKLANALCYSIVLFGTFLYGQDIRIKVVNGKNGKPITDECLNIWFGRLHGSSFVAPTNAQGVVVLHVRDQEVNTEAVSQSPCPKFATVGPIPIPPNTDAIYVWTYSYAACQETGKMAPGGPANGDLPEKLTPSYSIERIRDSGLVVSNRCGKVHEIANPGELVYFLRPLTFWEKLRL